MEKRPPANVGDLERQREKHVHLGGGGKMSRSLVWKAVDLVPGCHWPPPPYPQSASFLLSWDVQPLFHYLIHSANVSGALLCSFPPSGTRSRRDVIIITLFEKALIHSFQAGYVKHGPLGPMLPISHAAEKVLVG